MSDEITTNIAAFISSTILKDPGRPLAGSEALISSGLVDSFNLVDLALYVEDTFGVHIDDTELAARVFDTLDELAALVRQRMGSSGR